MYMRSQGRLLARRLAERRWFIQVVAGPRQTGKTTLVRQVSEEFLTRPLADWAAR